MNFSPSRIAYWICAALVVATSFLYYPKWEQPETEATISWDVSGYYLYLPAALIYQDVKHVAFFDSLSNQYHPGPGMGQVFKHPSGNYVMKYSMGQALQFLPWFLVAHLLAEPLGYPADGFSLPYQAAITWGSLIVALLGLWVTRRNLLHFFSERTVAVVLLCLTFGTNYLNYTAIDGAMTHNWLFTLYSLLVFSTIQFYRTPDWRWAAAIGACVGWAVLTRPTEMVSVLIPVLWGVRSLPALRERVVFYWKNYGKMALAVAVAGAIIALQPLYWHWATGEWIVYSYQDQGFSWLKPHLTDVLFSARAGWLIYSPMLIFAVLGFFALWRQQRAIFPGILLFCGVFLYITAAWDIWWYGGSLGQRAMVQSYPLWVFPLAALVQWVTARTWRSAIFALLAGSFIYLNLWWTHQAHRGGLFVSEQMTKRYVLKVLGRYEMQRDWLKFLDINEEYKGGERQNVREILTQHFENDTTAVTTDAPISGTKSLLLNGGRQFSPEYTAQLLPDTKGWVRATTTFRCDPKEWDTWKMTQFIVRFYNGDQKIKEVSIRLQRHVDGAETKTLFFDTRLPKQASTSVRILFWNADSDKTVRLDDLKMETFE